MKRTAGVIFLYSLFIVSCEGQKDNGKIYNEDFAVNKIPNLGGFTTLNETEKALESKFSARDKAIDGRLKNDSTRLSDKKHDYINNRSRLLWLNSINGVEDKNKGGAVTDELPALCNCVVLNDTLFINSGFGFFDGAGVVVKANGTKFRSSIYEYTDGQKPYKLTSKSEFTNYIVVNSRFQHLQFESKPDFKLGQQLTGYLTLTSNDYFSQVYENKLNTNAVKVRMKFTCLTKKSGE